MEKNSNEEGGFIRIILVLIILLVFLNLAGYDIEHIWIGVIVPIVVFIGDIILAVVNMFSSAYEYIANFFK